MTGFHREQNKHERCTIKIMENGHIKRTRNLVDKNEQKSRPPQRVFVELLVSNKIEIFIFIYFLFFSHLCSVRKYLVGLMIFND